MRSMGKIRLMRRLSGLLACFLLVVLATVASAHAQGTATAPTAAEIAQALEADNIYVAPGEAARRSAADVAALRARIAERRAGPMYVAVVPEASTRSAGGDAGELLRDIAEGVRRPGVYALVAGRTIRAGATGGFLPKNRAG